MSSISNDQTMAIRVAARRIAKKYKIVGVCLYGSRVAGYSREDSDFDVIIVLENYPYVLKYIYTAEADVKISALVVDLARFEKDATYALLGEFVVGRLLHIYEPIENKGLFERIEVAYKRRVILDEIYNIVKSANLLSTQITFPLDYVMFSKLKYRSILYPNAAYSYYHTYTGKNSRHNIEFALNGYQKALEEILEDDRELLIIGSSSSSCGRQSIQISERRVEVQAKTKIVSLKLAKKLQEFSSYFIHAYAGRHTLRHVVSEAESKINRHKASRIKLPDFISSPRDLYWTLPEGIIVTEDNKDWLEKIAKLNGFSGYVVSDKRDLGTRNGATALYILKDLDNQKVLKSVVVKNMMVRPRRPGWRTGLHKLSSVMDRSKAEALFRLSTEYKALRYIRSLGLHSPVIESVVLGKRILITEFVEGKLVSEILDECMNQDNTITVDLKWINVTGQHMARVHAHKCTLGHIKPSNFIVSKNRLYFTGMEEFGFSSGDPLWDIAHFISHALKKATNTFVAERFLDEFFVGYSKDMSSEHIKKLTKSQDYLRVFYSMLDSAIVETVKKEISNFVN